MKPQERMVKKFVWWIDERETIRKKKEGGAPAPWTKDSVLRTYRFCNVARRDDRVSQWIIRRVINEGAKSPSLWIQLALARYINWPDTINALMEADLWPNGGTPKFRAIGDFLDSRAGVEKTWTGAYMIRAESNPNATWYDWGKGRYVAEVVVGGLWEKRAKIEHRLRSSVEKAHEALAGNYGWGSFMAGQVVADLTYAPGWLKDADDLRTFAPLGPGSRRGLNRILGRPILTAMPQEDANALMRALFSRVLSDLGTSYLRLTLHDIQNCLCEFDKYQRVVLGEGRPRSFYRSQS